MSDILKQAEEVVRDRDVHLYVEALNAGDFDTMIEIVERAESDPILSELLWQADVVPPEFVKRAQKMIKHMIDQYEERW